MKRWIVLLILVCQSGYAQQHKTTFTDYIQPAVFSLSMVMMHDVVNPPAACRFYGYATMAAYSIVAAHNREVPAASSFIRSYPEIAVHDSGRVYDHRIAAVYSILETGRQMLPSGFMLEKDEERLVLLFKKDRVPDSIIRNSIAIAVDVAKQVVQWSRPDGYGKLSTRVRYTPVKGEGYWYPTPPAYIEAVEPHWKTIRPMVIDSCNQFIPLPPVPFSKDSASAFFALNKEVRDAGVHLTMEQRVIASFWDCNPFAVSTYGHMAIGFKKITPGGHWMNITGIAARKAQLDFDKTVLVHAIAAVTMTDAFISCWDAKYQSNRIRPETYINRYIDVRWKPLLQTPPFPEYTSGHSVVSTAVATVLTYMMGDNFAYDDNSEEMFEIPARKFTSFLAASREAAISRLYGGIHYRDAIDNGVIQGQQVGEKVVEKIREAGIKPVYGKK
ncbi:vanadium-dependent haloperoxidase [Chitinophaga rhizophila]|uniref:Vanadium-dependent haloperoxidase n=1 Tax=Chitinophaga rhizophila TaxID=2866212 RepID=A0ABS7GD33_9BACT|nr:vanadium-dependent haloperoxidase [Chitinophaga rhizophila]MBW8685246.1 vanadium-dependent haloperoxidase [Chitinophaga rhizophila]